MTKRIYVAGPMTGIPHFNFPAFDAATERLRAQGWRVVNPAGIDRAMGFDPLALPADTDWNNPAALGLYQRDIVRRCCAALIECDAIYMLEGWIKSEGASAELKLARWAGLDEIYQRSPVEEAMEVIAKNTQALQAAVMIGLERKSHSQKETSNARNLGS